MTDETWLPNDAQRDLLTAALVPERRALEAWRRFRAGTGDATTLGPGAERLLPLVADNLAKVAEPSPHPEADAHLLRGREARLRGRFTGILRVRDASGWVAELARHGVPTLVLKGVALAIRYYRDFGLRPMEDVDLLVRPEHVPVALACVYSMRFSPMEGIPADCWPPRAHSPNLGTAAVTHGVGFITHEARMAGVAAREEDVRQLDLHWAALSTNCGDRADDAFWAAATPLPLHGSTALALAPGHELVHTIAHGARWNSLPSIRWVADAAMVVRAGLTGSDWDAFVAEVDRRGLALAAGPSLEHLVGYGIAIPDEVRARVARLPRRVLDRLRHEHLRWPWDRRKSLRVIAFDALRFAEGMPLGQAATRLARYARFRATSAENGRLSLSTLVAKLRARA